MSGRDSRGREEGQANGNGFVKAQRKGGRAHRSQWVQRDLEGVYDKVATGRAGRGGTGALSRVVETQAAELINPQGAIPQAGNSGPLPERQQGEARPVRVPAQGANQSLEAGPVLARPPI